MIPVAFPAGISLRPAPGCELRFEPVGEVGPGVTVSSRRIYLLSPDLLDSIRHQCVAQGIPPPQELAPLVIEQFVGRPLPAVGDLLREPWQASGYHGTPTICLFNGAGGGLGDAVLAGAAIRCLADRLREHCGTVPRLDVFSIFPLRTQVALQGIPGVQVLPPMLSLAQLATYHAVADCSGMLLDPDFSRRHMSDCFLQYLGLDPEAIPAEDKRPWLRPLPPSPSVAGALAEARRRAGHRRLVALVFRSALTRTMPDALAVRLLRSFWQDGWQPVIFLDDPGAGARFLLAAGLTDVVVDLSAVSLGFEDYIALLDGMDAIVSVDTSAVHIGAALNKPVVAIFNSIAKELRIQYSPTVAGIQISYRGKTCSAPCNLSKGLAQLSGTVANGQELSWRFSYPCDEAVDSHALLAQAKERLLRLDLTDEAAEQIEAIRQEVAQQFAAVDVAPCWQALDVDEVRRLLARITERAACNAPGRMAQR